MRSSYVILMLGSTEDLYGKWRVTEITRHWIILGDQTTSKDYLPYIIPPKLTIMKNYGLINNYDSWTCKEMGFNCERNSLSWDNLDCHDIVIINKFQ